jgi:spermidine synthase
VLWARDWALLYGSTAVGTAVVLAAYFAGLAAGSALVAGAAARRHDLRLFATLELAVAAAVLVYVALRPALPAVAIEIAETVPAALLPIARVAFALAVLGVPSALLGATLPAAAAVVPAGDNAEAGRLYAWNTLGGALGALACAFAAIRLLGVRGTFLASAGVDAAVGLVVLAGAWSGSPAATAPAPAGPARRALALAATAGFVGLADEVLWTRGLAGVLSNSVYSVALVLAAVLIGLVVGTRVGVRAVGDDRRIVARLAVAFILLALATVGSLVALRMLPALSTRLIAAARVTGPGAGLVLEATLALLVVLVPSVCLGAVFPLVLALARAAAPGRTMARVLAANTAGGIVGALAGAFVVLPALGLGGGLLLTATVALVAAATTGAWSPLGWLAVAAVGVAGVVTPTVHLPWRQAGTEEVVFYRDGATATVMVTRDAEGRKRLRVNGQYSLGGTAGLLLERREAHLPLLLHPAPERMLLLGVGTADTAGAALAHPGLEVDGVELVPEALAAAALFAPENAGALGNPRARFVVDDARTHLLASPATYDVILSDLFLPWTAGTAYLYSLDFYRLGLAHLRPGGAYWQWLPLHQLAVRDLEAIAATFVAAFPHVGLWVAYHRAATPIAALVGSATPLALDRDGMRARLADPTLAAALARVGLDDPDDVAILYVTDGRRLAPALAGVAPITDDRPRLEFTAPAAYFHQQDLGRAALAWVAARLDPTPADGTPFALRATLLQAQLALLAGDGPAELRAYLAAREIAPGVRAVRVALASIGTERLAAGDRRIALLVADALHDTREGEALGRALAAPR